MNDLYEHRRLTNLRPSSEAGHHKVPCGSSVGLYAHHSTIECLLNTKIPTLAKVHLGNPSHLGSPQISTLLHFPAVSIRRTVSPQSVGPLADVFPGPESQLIAI